MCVIYEIVRVTLFYHVEGLLSGKQDPFVELIVGDGTVWKYVSDVKENSGVRASWNLNISERMELSALKEGMLTLRVMDRDPNKDKLIGRSAVDLQALFTGLDEWVEIEGILVDANQQMAGEYILRMRYRTKEEDRGKLQVRKLAMTSLKNTGSTVYI